MKHLISRIIAFQRTALNYMINGRKLSCVTSIYYMLRTESKVYNYFYPITNFQYHASYPRYKTH